MGIREKLRSLLFLIINIIPFLVAFGVGYVFSLGEKDVINWRQVLQLSFLWLLFSGQLLPGSGTRTNPERSYGLIVLQSAVGTLSSIAIFQNIVVALICTVTVVVTMYLAIPTHKFLQSLRQEGLI